MSSSPVSSSPAPFYMSSEPASTAPTSPTPADASDGDSDDVNQVNLSEKGLDIMQEEEDKRYSRLQFVLDKSAIYSKILKARMDEDKEKQKLLAGARAKAAAASGKTKVVPRSNARVQRGRGKKRARVESEDSSDEEGDSKRMKNEDGEAVRAGEDDEDSSVFQQPALITGAQLKPYQLEGLQWMVSLDTNGISGILADEMGLGKTLQTIAFCAHLRESKNFRPFLVVCPLSVLHNWVDEFSKFAPTIPVCMYHGSPAERAELRRTVMALPSNRNTSKPSMKKGHSSTAKRNSGRSAKSKSKAKTKPQPASKATKQSNLASFLQPKGDQRRSGRLRKAVYKEPLEVEEDDDEVEHAMELDGDSDAEEDDEEKVLSSFPVVLTTYEMIIKDRVHLSNYGWGYIVVDEGHRLKNLNCKLIKEIKKYTSAGRMILTGTPLHNNLGELWSLLNFILPDIFDDVDAFQEWFNLPTMQASIGSERSSQLIGSLHAILKPFLLRRLKADVEHSLPPKKEYVLYAPLSVQQREAYNQIVEGTLRSYLIGKGDGKMDVNEAEADVKEVDDGKRRLRKKGRKSYAVDGDDDEYFDMLENGEVDERGVKEKAQETAVEELAKQHRLKSTLKQVNNMKLQNTVMQLRKVCSHPFLFDWPLDPVTLQPALNEDLVNVSGKMMVLDRLLRELFSRKHKVLLFSQFTTMLDIIEDWACEFMGWKICRIDGSTPPLERREQMNIFQKGGDRAGAPHLFLLSTRAGGLGINLTAADTVIFYDQDWNPQMDAQAQDRAHRIGQTKPVLIFRLVSAHTIETKIMQRATEKRKLEALVIAKGKFKKPAGADGGKVETMTEMAASLLRLEGEKIDVVPNTAEGKAGVLGDEDLEMLLDRSPEVFADRGQGWTSTAGAIQQGGAGEGVGKKTAFAVYEAPVDQGNDALAKMLGEDIHVD